MVSSLTTRVVQVGRVVSNLSIKARRERIFCQLNVAASGSREQGGSYTVGITRGRPRYAFYEDLYVSKNE